MTCLPPHAANAAPLWPLSGAVLHEVLRYDPETGKLFWKERGPELIAEYRIRKGWNAKFAGKEALIAKKGDGYLVGRVFGRCCRAHQVAFAMSYGRWPTAPIDHIDGDRRNNRLSNLREVTAAENNRNAKVRSDSKTGVVGVRWYKASRKWEAQISYDGKKKFLGLFEAFDDAVAARKAAEKFFGYHPNHGRGA